MCTQFVLHFESGPWGALAMKKYYHEHELAYLRIKSEGNVGWGNAKTLEDLGDASTHEYLRKTTQELLKPLKGKKALDLGCGTGTTAFTLAKLGFEVTGIDISQTAIEMAHELAKKQKLDIRFEAGDVLQLCNLKSKFDLIYDSHCLHCIVFDEDRSKVLTEIQKSLTDSGFFILDTMISTQDFKPSFDQNLLRFDENYTLWHKTSKENKVQGVVSLNGEYWCAQRRILPEESIVKEVHQAKLKVVCQQIDAQDITSLRSLRMVLQKL